MNSTLPWYPHLTVACVIEKEDHYLLVKEFSEGKEVINQPAGHVDEGENVFEAAVRECAEETGWHVELEALLGFSQSQAKSTNTTYFRLCFIAKAVKKIPDARIDPDIISPLWMHYDDILACKDQHRSPMVLRDIEQYRQGLRYPLELIYEHR